MENLCSASGYVKYLEERAIKSWVMMQQADGNFLSHDESTFEVVFFISNIGGLHYSSCMLPTENGHPSYGTSPPPQSSISIFWKPLKTSKPECDIRPGGPRAPIKS